MSAPGQTMPIDSARRMSAFASYHPETAIPLPANSGRLGAVGEGPSRSKTEVAARHRDVRFTPETGLGSRDYEYTPLGRAARKVSFT